MTKIISPLLFRVKSIPNCINNIHLKLTSNRNNITYFKFFQLILNVIYLFKYNIKKYRNIYKNFLYFECNNYNFKTIQISIIFYKLKIQQLILLYSNIIKLFNYLNYFIKFNLYKTNYFLLINIKKLINNYGRFKIPNTNNKYIITIIQNYLREFKNFKKKIIIFLNSLLKQSLTIQGIKCIYSGCLYKNSKKKSLKYIKGKTSLSSIMSNVIYTKKSIKTTKGIIGIKLWVIS